MSDDTARKFEDALIALSNAVDGRGLKIRLFPHVDYSSIELRRATNDFARIDFANAEFFGRDTPEKTRGMAAHYRNLALLANAAAAAIEHEAAHP